MDHFICNNKFSFINMVFRLLKVFRGKNLPFRSFVIEDRNEKVLGELFTFFILETILLGMAMKINPFDQPAVELIKTKTTNILKKI